MNQSKVFVMKKFLMFRLDWECDMLCVHTESNEKKFNITNCDYETRTTFQPNIDSFSTYLEISKNTLNAKL